MKNALIYGTIAGVISMLWTIIGGMISPVLVYGALQFLLGLSILSLLFMYLASQKEKVRLNGTIRFGEALLVSLATFAVLLIISSILSRIYYAFSPSMFTVFIETNKESYADIYRWMGMSEDQIFEAMEGFDLQYEDINSISTILMGIFGALFFPGSILALITAAITSNFKKKATAV